MVGGSGRDECRGGRLPTLPTPPTLHLLPASLPKPMVVDLQNLLPIP